MRRGRSGHLRPLAAAHLPDGYQLAWSGQSYQEKTSGQNTLLIFGLAVLMVFLILAAQYERLTLPFAVILAVPFAVFGAFLAVLLRGLYNDLYLQIGLPFPEGVFDNSPSFAYIETAPNNVERFRGISSEPAGLADPQPGRDRHAQGPAGWIRAVIERLIAVGVGRHPVLLGFGQLRGGDEYVSRRRVQFQGGIEASAGRLEISVMSS